MYQQVKWAFRSSSTTKSMAACHHTSEKIHLNKSEILYRDFGHWYIYLTIKIRPSLKTLNDKQKKCFTLARCLAIPLPLYASGTSVCCKSTVFFPTYSYRRTARSWDPEGRQRSQLWIYLYPTQFHTTPSLLGDAEIKPLKYAKAHVKRQSIAWHGRSIQKKKKKNKYNNIPNLVLSCMLHNLMLAKLLIKQFTCNTTMGFLNKTNNK